MIWHKLCTNQCVHCAYVMIAKIIVEFEKMKKLIFLVACLFAGSANATPIFFSDRASFDASTGGSLSFESFESDFAVTPTIAFAGFTVSETGGVNALAQLRNFPGAVDGAITDGTGAIGYDDNGSSIGSFFSFTSLVNAIGLDIATSQASIITIGGSVSDTISLAAGTPSFWGVIDMAGITSLTFNFSRSPIVGFDAVSFGQTNASVPEPATLALMGLGLAGLGFSLKRKAA